MKRSTVLTALVSAAAMLVGIFPQLSPNRFPPSSSRSFEFTFVIHVPALHAGSKQLRMWIPLPYEGAAGHQNISQLKIDSPVKYRISREGAYGNRYAYLDLKAAQVQKAFDIRESFHATRYGNRVALTGSGDAARAAHIETARYLLPDKLVPIDGQIAELSAEQTKGATTPLEKARRIYDYVIATMHYDHDGTGWGHGDAIYACTAKHGNCTDVHSLFIAMARAAGVFARFEIGFPLPTDSHSGATCG